MEMAQLRRPDVVLATERLLLRRMDRRDLAVIAAMLGDPAVMRYYPSVLTRADAEQWLGRRIAQYGSHGYSLWLVVERATGEAVGQVGLVPQMVDGVEEAELGWLIASRHWRRGFASEAGAQVRDHAFTVLGRRRVISLIRPENMASQAVARKLGLEVSGRTVHLGFEHLLFALRRSEARRDHRRGPHGRREGPKGIRKADPTSGPAPGMSTTPHVG